MFYLHKVVCDLYKDLDIFPEIVYGTLLRKLVNAMFERNFPEYLFLLEFIAT